MGKVDISGKKHGKRRCFSGRGKDTVSQGADFGAL
jgi:hypothetical protein